jgi:hypothetical protein
MDPVIVGIVVVIVVIILMVARSKKSYSEIKAQHLKNEQDRIKKAAEDIRRAAETKPAAEIQTPYEASSAQQIIKNESANLHRATTETKVAVAVDLAQNPVKPAADQMSIKEIENVIQTINLSSTVFLNLLLTYYYTVLPKEHHPRLKILIDVLGAIDKAIDLNIDENYGQLEKMNEQEFNALVEVAAVKICTPDFKNKIIPEMRAQLIPVKSEGMETAPIAIASQQQPIAMSQEPVAMTQYADGTTYTLAKHPMVDALERAGVVNNDIQLQLMENFVNEALNMMVSASQRFCTARANDKSREYITNCLKQLRGLILSFKNSMYFMIVHSYNMAQIHVA